MVLGGPSSITVVFMYPLGVILPTLHSGREVPDLQEVGFLLEGVSDYAGVSLNVSLKCPGTSRLHQHLQVGQIEL